MSDVHVTVTLKIVVVAKIRPYLFDLLLRGQKWLASQVGRSV